MSDLVERIQRETNRRDLSKIVGHLRAVADGTRSAAERLATDFLRRAGIEGWAANHPISSGRLIALGDIAFESCRLVVEVDGWAYHVAPEAFQVTASVRIGWSRRAGRCCGSPGGTSPSVQTA